jgi:hypothetical protein
MKGNDESAHTHRPGHELEQGWAAQERNRPIGELTGTERRPRSNVDALRQGTASSSAEKVAIRLIGEQLGVALATRQLPLPSGGRIEPLRAARAHTDRPDRVASRAAAQNGSGGA